MAQPTSPVILRPKLSDIAARAKVSVAAVSLALADSPRIGQKTKLRVQRISHEMNYRKPTPKSNPRVPSRPHDIQRFGFAQFGGPSDDPGLREGSVFRALALATASTDVRLDVIAIADTSDNSGIQRRVLEFAKGLNGLLLMGWVGPELLQRLDAANIAYVVMGHVMAPPSQVPDWRGQVVGFSEERMGRVATAYLLALGHRRIGFACETLPPGLSHFRWLSGLRLAHLDAGLPLDPDLVHVAGKPFAGGAAAVEHFLSMTAPPSAYVIPDGRIAATFLTALRQRGVEPSRDTVVIGARPQTAQSLGLDVYPLVYADVDRFAELALRQLQEACRHTLPGGTELIVPFETRNFQMSG